MPIADIRDVSPQLHKLGYERREEVLKLFT